MNKPGPPGRSLSAPGSSSSGSRVRLPGVNERLAPPETRVEYLRGGEMYAAPADQPHATLHGELAYALRAHVATGYRTAVDMLTRTGAASDFAPDASVFAPKVGGGRKLEELAFEVTDKQAIQVPTEKARELSKRGVRRVFAILVEHQRVLEWSREADGWASLRHDALIEDRCFVRPLPVRALLDATAGDDAVVRALLAKNIPALKAALDEKRQEGHEEGREEGHEEGREEGELRVARSAVLDVLAARGLAVPRAFRHEVDACTDLVRLRTWLVKAATSTSAAEVLGTGSKR